MSWFHCLCFTILHEWCLYPSRALICYTFKYGIYKVILSARLFAFCSVINCSHRFILSYKIIQYVSLVSLFFVLRGTSSNNFYIKKFLYNFNPWSKICRIAAISWHNFVAYANRENCNVGFILAEKWWDLLVTSIWVHSDISSLRFGVSLLSNQFPYERAISDHHGKLESCWNCTETCHSLELRM